MATLIGVQVIYGLRDPTTGNVRYIGRTNLIDRRVSQHYTADTKVGRWLRSLSELARLDVLDVVLPQDAPRVEGRWIERLRARGVPLLNDTPGFGYSLRPRWWVDDAGVKHFYEKHKPWDREDPEGSKL